MKHLIICREFPPAPSGGIGVYASLLSRLLADRGDTVHVIGELWEKLTERIEQACDGRLVIHRVPYEDGASLLPRRPHPALKLHTDRSLFRSEYPPQCFSWQASLLAEKLVEQERIDLIEAQEYEAPLYYFQLRRALGLGPKWRPPCVVHLHSPTEFIARHNDWDLSLPGVVTAKRLEEYSIVAADSLLCPSHYLARQVEARYGLEPAAVEVVPYPIGDRQVVSRPRQTWESGTICFVGRLEPRKGVLEWIEAAITVAQEYPGTRFDFIGADTTHRGTSVRATMERRIPASLRSMFRFHGERPRNSLPRWLADARIAVVPSRWENFPFSCMEAMGSGLPVLASREGGMAEMIDDGRTGWLSESTRPDQLADALRRALATPPLKLAEMGTDAAAQIRRMCADDKVVDARRSYHDQLIRRGATQSLRLPSNLSRGRVVPGDRPCPRVPTSNSPSGISIVVTCAARSASLAECLRSLAEQTRKPVSVIIARHGALDDQGIQAMTETAGLEAQVMPEHFTDVVSARNAAAEMIFGSGCNPIGVAFLSEKDWVKPSFVAVCESILEVCPEVGLVSCWSEQMRPGTAAWVKPCPSFPYQWMSNDAVPFSVMRTESLVEAGNYRVAMKLRYGHWDLCNAVLANGWVAVTVPEVLARSPVGETACPHLANSDPAMRAELLGRFPDLVARDAQEIATACEARLSDTHASSWGEFASRARIMIRYPRSAARQIFGRLKNKFLRYTGW